MGVRKIRELPFEEGTVLSDETFNIKRSVSPSTLLFIGINDSDIADPCGVIYQMDNHDSNLSVVQMESFKQVKNDSCGINVVAGRTSCKSDHVALEGILRMEPCEGMRAQTYYEP